jgi:glycosyltransferase involved in cell wall biosynthesis
LNIGTIYTLYGARAGSELYFEKTAEMMAQMSPEDRWTIFCNREAEAVLAERIPSATRIPIGLLESQFKKPFWLECVAPRLLKNTNLDVFWISSGANSFPGRWRIPTLVTLLDLGEFIMKNKYDFKRTVYRKHVCIPRSIERATALSAISQNTADDVSRLFPTAQRPTVIYPGISPRLTKNSGLSPEVVIESETGLSLKAPIFFAPARTDFLGKGRDVLLQAYAQLRDAGLDLPSMLMPGPPGVFHDRMLREINRLNLQGQVIWPGRVSDECMDAFYAISLMMILPSRYEGFGFPVLEAMEKKVPVICSDAGSLREIAGDAALVIPCGDVDQLAQAMRMLLCENAIRTQLIERGLERVRAFSWSTTALGMRYLMQNIVKHEFRG